MRDSSPTEATIPTVEDEGHPPRLNDVSKKFIADCIAEKERLSEDFPVAAMLIDEAIDRVYATGRIPGREMHADVFKQKLLKVTQKVFVPIKQFPNFNFNGKILGPRGNSLRNLQKQTLCRILIKGRHSMRDVKREEEMRESGDPRHAHLNKDLYVEISTVANPAEAHARIAYALSEIRKYLIPDSNDEVSQSQRNEMLGDPEFAKRAGAKMSDERGRANNKPVVSILQKITGFTSQPIDRERDYEEEQNDEEGPHMPHGTSRNVPLRQYMKRPVQEPSPYYQRRNEVERDAGRPSYRGQGGARPEVSILRKITGFTGKVYDDEEDQQEEYGGRTYEAEERGYSRKTREPIRQSQRPPTKRFYQEEPPQYPRRYENPQKRTRESPNGEQSTSRYSNY